MSWRVPGRRTGSTSRSCGSCAPRGHGPHGGAVTDVAELAGPPPAGLSAAEEFLEHEPRRQTWARPGGPASDVAWADERLRRVRQTRTGPAQQVRAWHLSSLWRLPTATGVVWLKVVPPFCAHEGDVIARIAIGPGIIAHDGPRSLLPDVPGRDLYDATGTEVRRMIGPLVDEQARWIDRTHELLSLGAPDWRGPALTAAVTDVVERTAPELATRVLAQARRLVAGLAARFAAIAACGIPDSLVHGDFHQGNVRSGGADMVVLDWGDCGVGHPLLRRSRVRRAPRHRRRRRGEHGFHRDDPANWITRAVR